MLVEELSPNVGDTVQVHFFTVTESPSGEVQIGEVWKPATVVSAPDAQRSIGVEYKSVSREVVRDGQWR